MGRDSSYTSDIILIFCKRIDILENLINNAWKFSQKNPSIIIEFGVDRQNGKSVYFIKDNGVGFEQKYSERAFEPFQRLHNEIDFEGKGIGLAIVKRIIDRHSGNIWVESEVNKSTVFYFTLINNLIGKKNSRDVRPGKK